jgi:hypothetical protein
MTAFSSWFLRGAAWLVVWLPVDTPLLPGAVEWPPLAQELRQLAEEEEWLDPRECVRRPQELLYWCQRLHRDLADYPRREELLRWPPREEVERALCLGHAYLRTCSSRKWRRLSPRIREPGSRRNSILVGPSHPGMPWRRHTPTVLRRLVSTASARASSACAAWWGRHAGLTLPCPPRCRCGTSAVWTESSKTHIMMLDPE